MRCLQVFFFIFMLCSSINISAQNIETDSLKKQLKIEEDDQKRVGILESLSYAYLSMSPDTALQYALQGLQLAQDIQFLRGQAICINAIGNVYFHTGDNAKALEMYFQYLQIKESLKDTKNLSVAYFNIASAYTEEEDYRHALDYLFKAKKEDESAKDSAAVLYDMYSLGSIYLRMKKNDSAKYYMDKAYEYVLRLDDKNMIGAVLNTYGELYFELNDSAKAANYYKQSIPKAEEVEDYEVLNADYFGLGKVYDKKGMPDSAIFYTRKAFKIAIDAPFFKQALETSEFLTTLFKAKNKYDSAFHYQEMSISIKDSLFNVEKLKKVQELKLQEQQRQQAIATERIKYQNNIKLFIAIFIAIIILIIAVLLGRSNKQNKKANLLLTEQKEKVESTLLELRATQAQLIQSEKMASLGELTAGIAHEIQNPLNFVNNFSEVNNELIDELKNQKSNLKIEEQDEILSDIFQNNEKIAFHGKRADAIVKGMLQHSRKNIGQKELTDINALCDEYLRLSYHGLRAKDKSFNAEMKTMFDETAGKINVVPQDIGRVLLNLFNNAFYAVNQKKNTENAKSNIEYKPVVFVETKKTDTGIEIRVEDNGSGIPKHIIDKIFQPFFTTKPTGEGTGLGLSITYDIITKEHNGTISVTSTEGEGTKFIIQLPAE
ncbi:MAG: tetratricopeptide repeat protein [Parafilimonas sp.]|nr:tetratricopeptide repeat protein [Parafilimonas sp.]